MTKIFLIFSSLTLSQKDSLSWLDSNYCWHYSVGPMLILIDIKIICLKIGQSPYPTKNTFLALSHLLPHYLPPILDQVNG